VVTVVALQGELGHALDLSWVDELGAQGLEEAFEHHVLLGLLALDLLQKERADRE
jgi:hypothetical protein